MTAFDTQHNYFVIQMRDSDAKAAIFVRRAPKLTLKQQKEHQELFKQLQLQNGNILIADLNVAPFK